MDPLLIVTRTLHYAAVALLQGTFAFWCLVARPALRLSKGASALEAPFDRRLLALAWTSLLVALVTGTAWLILVASHMSGLPLSAVVPQGVLGIVLTQTQFGGAWTLRGAFVVVLAVCLLAQTRRWRDVARWIGLAFSAALLVSLAWAGHAAAADDQPWDVLHLPADLLHLLATGTWLGALLPLSLFLVQVRRNVNPETLQAARTATLRFSTIGVTCVGTLIVTGIVNTWFLSGTIPALVGTLYGQLLLLKVALFAIIIGIASVNRNRLVPLLDDAVEQTSARLHAARSLLRNALGESSLGLLVLGVVGIIGTLPPGLHTEPRWPFPFTVDLAGLQPQIVPADPTTYYAPTQPYAAPSVVRGLPLYVANCAACHGVGGRGDGPFAARLPIRPADLTEEHLFAHRVGDMYWWVSNGLANGVMPGFADRLSPDQRWDVINFVLARASGILTNAVGSQITTAAGPSVPDFAFDRQGVQNTLSQTLETGPVFLVLLTPPVAHARLARLASLEPRLTAARLHVVAVVIGRPLQRSAAPVVGVSGDVRATLSLFRSRGDGGETGLMLDRNAGVRARWTATQAGGLPDAATLQADAVRVARIPAAAVSHAGHAQ